MADFSSPGNELARDRCKGEWSPSDPGMALRLTSLRDQLAVTEKWLSLEDLMGIAKVKVVRCDLINLIALCPAR